MGKFKDLTGLSFGRWAVLSKTNIPNGTKFRGSHWLCQCSCGTQRVVRGLSLASGKSKSCGCLNKEILSAMLVKRNTTHGLRYSRTYSIWESMKKRCRDPKNASYRYYGAIGITVCDRWIGRFENFLDDMGECPEGMSIDRIDTNSGYFKENCRWADATTQSNNRNYNRRITHNGETLTHAQWGRKLGGSVSLVPMRLACGWSETQAVTIPVAKTGHHSKFNGHGPTTTGLTTTGSTTTGSTTTGLTITGSTITGSAAGTIIGSAG